MIVVRCIELNKKGCEVEKIQNPWYLQTTGFVMNIIKKIKKLKLPLGKYVVVGSSSLEVRGIRQSQDIDIAVLPEVFVELHKSNEWSLDDTYNQKWNRKRLVYNEAEVYPDMILVKERIAIDINELIRTADIIEGVPFMSLDMLALFKRSSGREKDLKDIELIEEYLKTDA